jgi:SAM-dependent methyltransferase
MATVLGDYAGYLAMQKCFYESDIPSADIVGLYEIHERYPYETFLLFEHGDIRRPIFDAYQDRIALDFACGPGRMVRRMNNIFSRVDGVDISAPLVHEAKAKTPESNFWQTNGDDLGGAPKSTYDFIYSTIALQHICVHSVRMKIYTAMNEALKPGGKITLQMGFNPRFPFSKSVLDRQLPDGRQTVIYEKDHQHAAWREDRVNAQTTNSNCDVAIGAGDLADVREDFSKIFDGVDFWFHDGVHFDRNPGPDPYGYWPSHWIFIHAKKR